MQQLFKKTLHESNIEVYTDKDGKIKAQAVGQQFVSSKTIDKTNTLGTKEKLQPLSPTQKSATKAVIADLKDRGRLGDISKEMNINKPDITFKGNGDAVISPDNGSKPYKLPFEEIDRYLTENGAIDYYKNKTVLKETKVHDFSYKNEMFVKVCEYLDSTAHSKLSYVLMKNGNDDVIHIRHMPTKTNVYIWFKSYKYYIHCPKYELKYQGGDDINELIADLNNCINEVEGESK